MKPLFGGTGERVWEKTDWEAEVQEKLDVTLQSDQGRRLAQWISP